MYTFDLIFTFLVQNDRNYTYIYIYIYYIDSVFVAVFIFTIDLDYVFKDGKYSWISLYQYLIICIKNDNKIIKTWLTYELQRIERFDNIAEVLHIKQSYKNGPSDMFEHILSTRYILNSRYTSHIYTINLLIILYYFI